MVYRKSENDLPNINDTQKYSYENPAFLTSPDDISNGKSLKYLGGNNFTVIDYTDIDKSKDSQNDIKLLGPWVKQRFRNACTKKNLYRKIPILSWLPQYNSSYAVGDLVAGITVGLTLIPQGLAFSSIVGVPVQHGLYGSFLGCFIYIIFGSCKDVSFGPTAIQSLLVFQAAGEYGLEYVILLCFLAGVVQVLMGILSLGFLVDFISGPVSSGFTSASSLIVVVSLMKDVLGIQARGKTFIDWCIGISRNIRNVQLGDSIIGFSCIIFLLLMKYLCSKRIGSTEPDSKSTKARSIINKIIWFLGISRNAIAVIICAVIGYKFCMQNNLGPFSEVKGNVSNNQTIPFKVIGNVPAGLPEFRLPPFGFTELSNGTKIEHSFLEMSGKLSAGIFVVALVGLLEDIAVCKVFANGKTVDATQELIALGVGNVVNSFVQAFSGTGAIARSAVNNASGAKTTLGGLYSGILVMVSLLVFTPYFYFIPRATLSAIIITAVLVMIEVKILGPMWNTKKSDFVLWLISFIACLIFPLEIGILVGVFINLMLILYHSARPKITIERLQTSSGIEFLLLTPDRSLIFPSTDYVKKLVLKHSVRQRIPVVMDCSHIYGADYTAATVISTLTQDFSSRNQHLMFYNLKPSVCNVFKGVEPKDLIVFYDINKIDELLNETDCDKYEAEIVSK